MDLRDSADANRLACDDEEPVELVHMVGKDVRQPVDAEGQVGYSETQVDDARVRPSTAEDKFAEIPVVSDQYALLMMGERKDVHVVERAEVLLANRRTVVT